MGLWLQLCSVLWMQIGNLFLCLFLWDTDELFRAEKQWKVILQDVFMFGTIVLTSILSIFPVGSSSSFLSHFSPSGKTVRVEGSGRAEMGVGGGGGLQGEDGGGCSPLPQGFVEDWIKNRPPWGSRSWFSYDSCVWMGLTSRPGEGSNMLVFKLHYLPLPEAVLYALAGH